MKSLVLFLLPLSFLGHSCTQSCDNYKLNPTEARIIQDIDPALRYVNSDQSDTIQVIPQHFMDQGPDKERKMWVQGYRACGARGNMDYSNNTAVPYFRVLFDLNKQQINAIEIPTLQIGRLHVKKEYSASRLTLFNNQNSYTITYLGDTAFGGREVEEVYEFTGIGQETGNSYIYSLYEGLLRIEEQGKSWERIW